MNFRQYVHLIEQAEKKMLASGKTSLDDRLYMLGGIYYATFWSVEYRKLKADDRRKAFARCLHKDYSMLDDPRPVLGGPLYELLSKNQDVKGSVTVDMGHLLIGMAARLNADARTEVMNITDLGGIPLVPSGFLSTKSTGLEILTWVGDLGGAAGRLALDRAEAAARAKPGAKPQEVPASKYFRGFDYGGPSNLYGDVYAYVLAADNSGSLGRPAIGPHSGGPANIGDAFEAFFLGGPKGGKASTRGTACATFLTMLGATFGAKNALTNQAAVQSSMADKLEGFGRFYILSYLKTFGTPPPKGGGGILDKLEQAAAAAAGAVQRFKDALPFLRTAAEDIAKLFLSKLKANKLH